MTFLFLEVTCQKYGLTISHLVFPCFLCLFVHIYSEYCFIVSINLITTDSPHNIIAPNPTNGLCLLQLCQQLLGLPWILTWAMPPLFSFLSHLPLWSVCTFGEFICYGNSLSFLLEVFFLLCTSITKVTGKFVERLFIFYGFPFLFCSVNQHLLYFFSCLLLHSSKFVDSMVCIWYKMLPALDSGNYVICKFLSLLLLKKSLGLRDHQTAYSTLIYIYI